MFTANDFFVVYYEFRSNDMGTDTIALVIIAKFGQTPFTRNNCFVQGLETPYGSAINRLVSRGVIAAYIKACRFQPIRGSDLIPGGFQLYRTRLPHFPFGIYVCLTTALVIYTLTIFVFLYRYSPVWRSPPAAPSPRSATATPLLARGTPLPLAATELRPTVATGPSQWVDTLAASPSAEATPLAASPSVEVTHLVVFPLVADTHLAESPSEDTPLVESPSEAAVSVVTPASAVTPASEVDTPVATLALL